MGLGKVDPGSRNQHEHQSARQQFLGLVQAENADRVIADIRLAHASLTQDRLLTRAHAFPMLLAFLLAAFNQLSGIDFIIYFAPRVFELAGLDGSAALLSTAGIGAVNVAATLLGLYLIDRSGRSSLMLIGSIGYIVSLATVSWGQSLGCGTHWVFAALITLRMPYLLGRYDGRTIFAFFALMMLLQPLFVLTIMPETRGSRLESLGRRLARARNDALSAQ